MAPSNFGLTSGALSGALHVESRRGEDTGMVDSESGLDLALSDFEPVTIETPNIFIIEQGATLSLKGAQAMARP